MRDEAVPSTWMAALIFLLVTAVTTDRLGLRVGDVNLRLEFIVGGLVVVAAILMGKEAALRGWGLVDVSLGGWLVVNLVSSLLFSPVPRKSLKYVIVLAGLVTIYAAARLLIRSEAALVWAAAAFVGMGTAVALLGLACALLFNVIGPNFGVHLERAYREGVLVVVPKAQSLLWEPNIYGSVSLCVCTLAAALGLDRQRTRPQGPWALLVHPRLAIAATMGGVVLSMTRTVWAVGPPLILLVTVLAWRLGLAGLRRIAATILGPALLGGLIGLAIGLSLPAPRWSLSDPGALTREQVDDMVRQRMFGTIPDPTHDTVPYAGAGQNSAVADRVLEVAEVEQVTSMVWRRRISAAALEGWLRRPILGWGAGSFPLVYPSLPPWIANATLHVLFDSGIVGLLLVATAVGSAGRRALSTIRYPPARWDAGAYVTFGLLCAGLGLVAAFQLTDGTWLGFAWVLLAMLVAAGGRTRGRDASDP